MTKELLIVFVKNIKLGKVKTRLAKTIGDEAAFNIYKELVKITENVTKKVAVEKYIYFSDVVIESKWTNCRKKTQRGVDLGERMKNAFDDGFDNGFEKIVLIGSDLPDLSVDLIGESFSKLSNNDVVIGPAVDGGYYLIGMSKMSKTIFENKPWSQSELLKVTLEELSNSNKKTFLLDPLNDIDTFEDLVKSDFYIKNTQIQKLINIDPRSISL